jgi:hypothetical protein
LERCWIKVLRGQISIAANLQVAAPPIIRRPKSQFLRPPSLEPKFWFILGESFNRIKPPSTQWLLRCAESCYDPIHRNVAYDRVLFQVNYAVAAYIRRIQDVFISPQQDGKTTKKKAQREGNLHLPLPDHQLEGRNPRYRRLRSFLQTRMG